MAVRSAGRGVRLGILFLLAAVVAAGVAAVPASAAPTPTTLTAKAQASTIVYGKKTVITGTLATAEDPPLPVGGQWVDVYYGLSASGPWNLLAQVTTDAAQYATGQYAAAVVPTQHTWYYFGFAGTGAYAAIPSNIIDIQVRPALGKPNTPRTVRHGTKFTVWGTLKPHFTAGARTVKVKVYRMNSHRKWVWYKTVAAKNYDYRTFTKYKVSLKLTRSGTYRFRAITLATASWAAGKSVSSRWLTVR